MNKTISPSERFHEHFNLTLTGAPTANGFKFYLVFLAMLSSSNFPYASPLLFLGRYLSRRLKFGKPIPVILICALPRLFILLLVFALIHEDLASKL